MKSWSLLVFPLLLNGCSLFEGSPTYTLYRNSNVSLDFAKVQARRHVATFDVDDSSHNFNRDNCAMASRLYNANIQTLNPITEYNTVQRIGFWCEEGRFRGGEEVPAAFKAEFPTDTE